MKYTLEELEKEVFKNVYCVYDIFKDFFGERFVDLQFRDSCGSLSYKSTFLIPCTVSEEILSDTDLTEREIEEARILGDRWIPSIYVWWPSVVVTNEYDKSIVIKDLYAKIDLNLDGKIPYEYEGFKLMRATYPYIQFKEGYAHSHLPRLNISSVNDIVSWRNPCLGRGPIRNTILDLHNNCEEALWLLFCQELSLYVTVESVSGIPYFRLEELGTGTLSITYNCSWINPVMSKSRYLATLYRVDSRQVGELLDEFIKYYIEHCNLSFSYKNDVYVLGTPIYDVIIDMSNLFVKWYNSLEVKPISKNRLFRSNILNELTVANRKFYQQRNNSTSFNTSDYEGMHLFNFKGASIDLHIERNTEDISEENTVTLLSIHIIEFIINSILKVINYRYENGYAKKLRGDTETSSTYKDVYYL